MAGGITDKNVEKYMYEILPARDAVLADMERLAKRCDIPIIGPAEGRMSYMRAEIYYTDGDPSNARRAKEFFERAGVEKRITVMTGDAMAMLDRTKGQFDLIFIDVDKHQYPAALRKALPRLKSRGLLLTDNTLWSGRVSRRAKDANTRGVQEFNKTVYSSKELFPVLIPLRDGVTVCRKR